MTLNSDKIKPIALAVIKLWLSKEFSQSRKIEYFVKVDLLTFLGLANAVKLLWGYNDQFQVFELWWRSFLYYTKIFVTKDGTYDVYKNVIILFILILE